MNLKTRDAGAGIGGGKLQRDALCTRGRQGKTPYSNRNLRWHPLILAHETPSYAKEAVLGMAIATAFYGVELYAIYENIASLLRSDLEALGFRISQEFPSKEQVQGVIQCPLCLKPINEQPAGMKPAKRPSIWQTLWQTSKRKEGEEESLQLTHVEPLIESEIRHTPSRVRYGHRWCNVAMTDHSVDETLNFMKAILETHET